MISFTGSPEVGWSLKQKAWDKRVALELGGNAACILEPETDLDFAVPRLAAGCFGYAGQVCISVQRILVHEAIRAEFDARMRKHLAENFKTGNPREEGVTCGPLIDKAAADRVMEWIEEAVAGGARLLCGGRRLADNMIEPTLIEGVPPRSPAQLRGGLRPRRDRRKLPRLRPRARDRRRLAFRDQLRRLHE